MNLMVTFADISREYENVLSSSKLCKTIDSLLGQQKVSIQDCKGLVDIILDNGSNISPVQYTLKEHKTFSGRADNQGVLTSIYLWLLMEIVYMLKNYPRRISIDLDVYFTYQPPEIFSRISNQQSFFVYQPYIFGNDGVYDYGELTVQKINPDILIEVDNYSKILNDLNHLGIDDGIIFGDADNIT